MLVSWLLILMGVTGIVFGVGLLFRRSPPSSSHATAPRLEPALSTKKPEAHDVKAYTVAPTLPKYIAIPSIRLDETRVVSLGLLKNNQIASPNNIYDAGWYAGSAKPGEAGAMFIYGHVSSWQAKGVFYDLKKLMPGEQVLVTRGDNKKLTYKVITTKTYQADKVDMDTVLRAIDAGKPGLNLMTCTGHVIKGTNEFDQRLVVFTTQVN